MNGNHLWRPDFVPKFSGQQPYLASRRHDLPIIALAKVHQSGVLSNS